MEPFTWIGLGAALLSAIQLARGKVDFTDIGPSLQPRGGESGNPCRLHDLSDGCDDPRNLCEKESDHGVAVCGLSNSNVSRSTRLFSGPEQAEAAEAMRRAVRRSPRRVRK